MEKPLLKLVLMVVLFFIAQANGQEAGAGSEEAAAGLAFITGGLACLLVGLVVAFRVMK